MFDFLSIAVIIFAVYFSSVLLRLNLTAGLSSEYELKRKARDGDKLAKKQSWVKKYSIEVDFVLKFWLIVFSGLAYFLIAVRSKKLWLGPVVILAVFLLSKVLESKGLLDKELRFWRKITFNNIQDLVLLLRPVFRKAGLAKKKGEAQKAYYSEDEFAYRFNLDSDVLSEGLRVKVSRMLKGSKTKAKDVMVEVKSIPKVDVNLGLTPMIYDELHKKGYDMALVFQGNEDNLVGLIYLSGSEAISQMNSASTVRVGDKMEQGLQ